MKERQRAESTGEQLDEDGDEVSDFSGYKLPLFNADRT